MSYIVIKAVPEELKHLCDKGNLIMYDDLSLYIKTQSDTIEKIKGKDYNKLMDYLEKSMKLYTSTNSPFTKRFNETESQILVYETDTNILTSIDENTFKSETGLKIKYEVGMTPEYFSPMAEIGNTYFLNDPANADNQTPLLDIITNMRNRLTYIQSILDISILYSAVTKDLNDKYLADGEGFNNTKYPYLKNITDDIATGNADTAVIETSLSSKYLPKGATFNTTKYPSVKSVVDHFSSVRMNTEVFKNKVLNNYLPKGDSYNSVKYPNIQTIVNYVNNLMDTINSVFTSLTYKIPIGVSLPNYPDAYAIVTKLTTLASTIANITNTINTLKSKTSNYLPKGDTTYPSVAYLVSEIETVKTSDASNYSMYTTGESALPASLDTALEIASTLEALITNIRTKIAEVVVNKLPYSDTYDIATYPNAQVIANKLSEISAEVSNQEEDFNTFITDVFPLYMMKNGFVPYNSFYKMYLDMLDIQKRMVKIDRVLNSTVCQVNVGKTIFTAVPKLLMGWDYGSETWNYIGGSSTPVCGTRLHPYYFATCIRADEGNAGTCDPVFQMAYKHTDGKYYAIKLPWQQSQEGTWSNNEYRDHVMCWKYGDTYTVYGQSSTTYNLNVDLTYAANEDRIGQISHTFHDASYWTDATFAAGCRGIGGLMYLLTYTGNLVKLDIPSFVAAWAAGSAALANYATPIKNLITGDAWIATNTFSASYYDPAVPEKMGFGYWSRRRSHIVDTGRVGGSKIICVGTRLSAGTAKDGGPGSITMCIYDKIKDKSVLQPVENEGFGTGDITYITELKDDLLYYENSMIGSWGFLKIEWVGSDFTVTKIEMESSHGAMPIICAVPSSSMLFVMDTAQVGRYHFIDRDRFDITSVDTVLRRTDTFGTYLVSETATGSPFRDLYSCAKLHADGWGNSNFYNSPGGTTLFRGINDGGRHIVYEPDQDDMMTLCVNHGRFKFTGKSEGIVITGEVFPIT